MTFLPCIRLMRWRRSFARWQASLDCPKGTSRAGAPSIFSSADATCTIPLTSACSPGDWMQHDWCSSEEDALAASCCEEDP